ncbi:hypothetical protein FRC19_010607 [Serendipita sp. 401]|nr:hypothetical protein FRC19_010607 [Serendipita sp. 401]
MKKAAYITTTPQTRAHGASRLGLGISTASSALVSEPILAAQAPPPPLLLPETHAPVVSKATDEPIPLTSPPQPSSSPTNIREVVEELEAAILTQPVPHNV